MTQEPARLTARGNGVALCVAVWEGRGRDILCIHGLSANSRCWDIIASSLIPDYRILAVDLRGRGQSEKPDRDYSVEVHVRDLRALTESLKLTKPVVIGHSLGAYIALSFAARYPDLIDSIVLIDGGGILNEYQMEQFQIAIKPALERLGKVFPSFEDYIAPMKMAPFFNPWTEVIQNYFRNDVREVPDGVVSLVAPETIAEETENFMKTDFRSLYPLVQCDTLILRATNGILTPDDILLSDYSVDELKKSLKSAWCVDIPDTNHYSIVFQENEYRDKILCEFLDGR